MVSKSNVYLSYISHITCLGHVHLAGKKKASKYLSIFNIIENKIKNMHFKSARKQQ